jgi:hypothetical protein
MLDRDTWSRAKGERLMSNWMSIAGLIRQVPASVWALFAVANLVVTVLTWSAARRRMRRAGERAADAALITGDAARTRDTALTVAAMVPAGLFWAMVLAGSLHGLVAFGRDVLGWRDGWEYLVPGTLDGVSVTFAFLAFRAVRMKKAPDRCYRVVWGAAVASATVNFAYEYTHSGHNIIAGGYLALLSLFSMIMLHEFLDQFEQGAAYVRRGNPKFGLRWLTWPTNTFCAAVAWRNHPPAEGTPATVLNAVANLDRVRARKQTTRDTKIVTRHQRAVAAARRREELHAAKVAADLPASGNSGGPGVLASVPAVPVESLEEVPARTAPIPPATPATPPRPKPDSQDGDDARVAGARVPATTVTILEWANLWIRMCADEESVLGPLNDDDRARTRYGLTAKHLRNVRNAATSGALRQKAIALRVLLPPGYADNPTDYRVNGNDLAGVAT